MGEVDKGPPGKGPFERGRPGEVGRGPPFDRWNEAPICRYRHRRGGQVPPRRGTLERVPPSGDLAKGSPLGVMERNSPFGDVPMGEVDVGPPGKGLLERNPTLGEIEGGPHLGWSPRERRRGVPVRGVRGVTVPVAPNRVAQAGGTPQQAVQSGRGAAAGGSGDSRTRAAAGPGTGRGPRSGGSGGGGGAAGGGEARPSSAAMVKAWPGRAGGIGAGAGAGMVGSARGSAARLYTAAPTAPRGTLVRPQEIAGGGGDGAGWGGRGPMASPCALPGGRRGGGLVIPSVSPPCAPALDGDVSSHVPLPSTGVSPLLPPCVPALDRGVCPPLPPPPGVETPHVLPEGGFGPEILRQEDPGTQGTPQDSQCHPKATKAPGGVLLESILAHHAGMHPTALLLFEGHSCTLGQQGEGTRPGML